MAGKKQPLTPEEKLARSLVPQDQQPYKLPKGWVWTRLGNIAVWGSGGTPSRKHPEFYNGNIPWVKTGELNDSYIIDTTEKITKTAISHSSAKIYPKDTVIIAMYGATIGKTGILGVEATTNQACACAQTLPCVYFKYLFYFLISQKFYFIERGKGGAQPNISQDILKKYFFPLPPLPEQQRIVARIESLFAKLDAARDKLQQVLDTQEARRAAILHEAFTGRLTGHKGSEAGSSQNILLKDCGTWHGGGTPSKSHEEYWENGDIMWITSKDMKSNLIDSSMVSINKKGVENSSAIYCEKPSVLFVMRSGILRHSFPVAVVKKPYTVNQDLKVLVPNPDILPEYIFWACKASEQNILHQCMKSGTTVESINFQALQQFKIPYYPLNLQEYIVKRINDLMKREDSVSEITQSTLSQIDLLKKSILARAFRGQLGTQDPSDPDARDLLTSDQ